MSDYYDTVMPNHTLAFNAARYPNKNALIYEERRFTYQALNERVNKLANGMIAHGVTKGSRVGYVLFNCTEAIEILLACLKTGAIAVPLNARLSSVEIAWSLNHVQCDVLFYSDAVCSEIEPILPQLPGVRMKVFVGNAALPQEHIGYENLCMQGNIAEPKVEILPSDMALLKFTGGTTGKAKAAVHTYESLKYMYVSAVIQQKMSVQSVKMFQTPLFHISGICNILAIVGIGATAILFNKVDPKNIMSLIEKEKVTSVLLMPPQTWLRILDAPDVKKHDLSSLRQVASSGGGSAVPIYRELFKLIPGLEIVYGWGQTETAGIGPLFCITEKMLDQDSDTLSSIGLAAPFQKIKIKDPLGNEVPEGSPGEAVLFGPSNFKGYFNNPEMTAKNLREGWVHTGDVWIKKDDYYFMVDRLKDMIKTGGENVFSEDVEATIRKHPAVEMVSVIGVPDPIFGEGILAVVKLREGQTASEDEIVAHCVSNAASYKKPRRVAFVDNFPVSDIGKVQKFSLRETFRNFIMDDTIS